MAAVWPVLLVALVGVVLTAPAHVSESKSKKLEQEQQLILHLKRVNQFRCKHPQPRLIPISELITGLPTHASYIPRATVLHRCDASAGCCLNERHSCGPKNSTTVDLVFRLSSAVPGVSSDTYFEMQAVNHTMCGCIDVRNHDRPK